MNTAMSERSEGINFAGVVTWYTGRQREACTVQPLESVTEAFKEGRKKKKKKRKKRPKIKTNKTLMETRLKHRHLNG